MYDSVPTFSIVLIGDSEVGKTSLIHRFVQNSFDSEQKSTIGALFHTFKTEIKGHTIMMQIWDTAGQEIYRSLGPIYYRKAQAAIAVYDVTNPKSFDGLDQWINEVKKNTINPIFYIAGNKCDLTNNFAVSETRAQAYASEHQARLFMTSAKTGDNVKQMFESLFEDITDATFQKTPATNIVETEENNNDGSCC